MTEQERKRNRRRKFLSFYKPYLGIFALDMLCAFIAAGVALVNPLIVRYITNELLPNVSLGEAESMLIKLLVAMLLLAVLQMSCNYFITYKGHMMGARMEYDMRAELFSHYQKLSFSFYDNEKTGQLMSRITNDLFDITELCHHGPEDIAISAIKVVGAFIILLQVNVWLTLIVFAFLPVMIVFASVVRKKMRRAFRTNREKIADINAGIEDNLSGIRVVKSFANEDLERNKFKEGNDAFLRSKRSSYLHMATFHSGLNLFYYAVKYSGRHWRRTVYNKRSHWTWRFDYLYALY